MFSTPFLFVILTLSRSLLSIIDSVYTQTETNETTSKEPLLTTHIVVSGRQRAQGDSILALSPLRELGHYTFKTCSTKLILDFWKTQTWRHPISHDYKVNYRHLPMPSGMCAYLWGGKWLQGPCALIFKVRLLLRCAYLWMYTVYDQLRNANFKAELV